MAGMRALGRVYDVVPAATGLDLCLKDCSGIGFAAISGATGPWTLTVVAKPSFGGSSATWIPGNGFGQPATWYQRTAATAAWTAQTASWASNVLTIAGTSGYHSYVDFLVSELADTYDYINVTASAAVTSMYAILYDPLVARAPQRLRIPSA